MYRICILSFALVLACVQAGLAQGWDPNTDPSLAAWWPFEEGAGNVAGDASGNGNDGTFVGDPQWVPGRVGGALEFNGDDYVNCGNGPSLQIRDEITIAFWFSVEAFQNTWEAFVAKGDNSYRASRGGGSGNGTHMGISGTSVGGGNGWFNAPTIITGGDWHHFAAVYDGSEARIYIDGVLDTTSAGTGQINESTFEFWIGENAQATGRFFHGLLDDVRLYSRALTVDEIKTMIPPRLKAYDPVPEDGTVGWSQPLLQWTRGDTAFFNNVYFGTDPEDLPLVAPNQPFDLYFHAFPLEPGTTYYWRVDGIEVDMTTIYTGDVWSFTVTPATAHAPSPRSGDKWIDPDADLNWTAGLGATTHEVYFSTDEALVAARDAVALVATQPATTFDPGTLDIETQYFWAVDEVVGGETRAGEVWTFTTGGGGGGGAKGEYFIGMTPAGQPSLTRIDPGIDFSWGNEGPGDPIPVDGFSARWSADLEIAVADTYTFIATSDDGVRLWVDGEQLVDDWVDRGTTDSVSDPVELEPGIYALTMEYYENGGGAVAQLSWETPTMARQIIPAGPLQPPVRARALYPANGAVDTPQSITLLWSPGEKAATHDVYFGDDRDAVANATPASAGIYRGNQTLENTSFNAGVLEFNKTYYWRIDELNPAEADSPWVGGVWSFTTADFIVVDDFEMYSNEVGNRIFQYWVDGLGYTEPAPGNPGNGSTAFVGHDVWSPDSPHYEGQIVETANVQGGDQAMPFYYNNSGAPFYGQADHAVAPAIDMTTNGVTDLSLWVLGAPVKFEETAPGTVTMSGGGADIWGTSDEFRFAYKSLNGNGSITAKVDSFDNLNGWTKVGLMIREGLDADAKHAMVAVTGTNGAQFAYRLFTGDISEDADAEARVAGITAPVYLKLTRTGNTFQGQYSADGVTWNDFVDGNGAVITQDITMMGNIYIGLAVLSHVSGSAASAQYSEIATTGAMGQWQVEDVGVAQPGNAPDDFYVGLSSGGALSVVSVGQGPVLSNEWFNVKVPLADFAGVNLGAVTQVSVGVGNPDAPVATGDGMLIVDSIFVVKPEPEPVVE